MPNLDTGHIGFVRYLRVMEKSGGWLPDPTRALDSWGKEVRVLRVRACA